jgi:ABC-type multidrug transport system fused ATPase/permease subunit
MEIIPQDPVLFSGTIRSNLDLENEYSDESVWDALDKVGLKDYVAGLDKTLDSVVEKHGQNLSQGQRQLLCLARAILAEPRILLMDEATSSVDSNADMLIQQVLKSSFSQSTVISIAHRLATIAEYDRIVVLDNGKLVEVDTPANLLKNSDSFFSQLVEASGTNTATTIRNLVSNRG